MVDRVKGSGSYEGGNIEGNGGGIFLFVFSFFFLSFSKGNVFFFKPSTEALESKLLGPNRQ